MARLNYSSSGDSAFWMLMYCVVFTYPWSIFWCSLSMSALTIVWLIWVIKTKTEHVQFSMLGLMLMLPAVFIISLLWTENLSHGWRNIEMRIPMFLFPVIMATLPPVSQEKKDRFFLAMLLSGFAAAFTCVVIATYDWAVFGVHHFYWKELVQPIGFHPGYFSFFLSVAIFWLLFYLPRHADQSDWKKYGLISIGLFLIVFEVLLAARVQLFLLFGTGVCIAFTWRNRFSFKAKVLTLLFFIAFLTLVYSTYVRHRISNIRQVTYQLNDPPQQFNELTIRMALAECSWKVIREHWTAGVGTGDAHDALMGVYHKHDYQYGYRDRQDPHNEYLNTCVATGMIGLILLVGNFVVSVLMAIRNRDPLHLIFISNFTIASLFESQLSQQKGIVLFSMLNAIFLFHATSRKNGSSMPIIICKPTPNKRYLTL